MTSKPEQDHWLARPETIRKLWLALLGFLVLLVLAGLVTHHEGHFWFDSLFGFNALLGFGACVVMVVVAKALSVIVKRSDTYYDD